MGGQTPPPVSGGSTRNCLGLLMTGMGETSPLRTGVGSGLTAMAAVAVGLLDPFEALCLAAGAALALVIAAGGSKPVKDMLYPARLQLARFRRGDKPADVLVVRLPRDRSISSRTAGRRSASAAAAVLRVTDGVALVPSLRGPGLCAVLEADPRARAAIEQRLSNACGNDIRVGWASCPDDGVSLESLVAVAVDRAPDDVERASDDARSPGAARRHRLRAGDLLAGTLSPSRPPMRRAR